MGLRSIVRPKKPRTKPGKPHKVFENKWKQDFHADKPNQKWCTDFTYLFLKNWDVRYNWTIIDLTLKTALTYTRNQRKYLETFLEDGRIPISNNDCETYIRPFANGRKAWLFADSPAGARACGIIYTLVETAKLNYLDVFGYLCYFLESLPDLDHRNHPELLEAYLPWSETLPESCRLREHRINKKCMFW